jgi:hypothetical protein
VFPDHPEQRRIRWDVDGLGLAVDEQPGHGPLLPLWIGVDPV